MPSHSKIITVGCVPADAIEDAWMDDLSKFSPPEGRPEGNGWMTVAEMAKKSGRSDSIVRRFVDSCPAGYWEAAERNIRNRRGHLRVTTYYRRRKGAPNFLKRGK